MLDTISRQAAIEALEREKSLVERPITETRWFDLGLGKAQDVLSELPPAQPERLPDDDKDTNVPINDCINRLATLKAIKNCESGESFEYNEGLIAAMNAVVDMPSAQEWISFAHWVAKEVIDEENWGLNCISFPEIACRKLNKLGIIDTDGRRWIYTPPKEEEK